MDAVELRKRYSRNGTSPLFGSKFSVYNFGATPVDNRISFSERQISRTLINVYGSLLFFFASIRDGF